MRRFFYGAVVITTPNEQKFARFLAHGFDVMVDGMPRLLRQFKPDGPTGRPLRPCGLASNWPKDRPGGAGDATVFQRTGNNE